MGGLNGVLALMGGLLLLGWLLSQLASSTTQIGKEDLPQIEDAYDLRSLFPDWEGAICHVASGENIFYLFDMVREAAEEAAAGRQVVLIIEDEEPGEVDEDPGTRTSKMIREWLRQGASTEWWGIEQSHIVVVKTLVEAYHAIQNFCQQAGQTPKTAPAPDFDE